MASGFLVLADGRCFGRNWATYDAMLRAVAEQLYVTPPEGYLRDWLLAQLPGPGDDPHLGYGPWLRKSDNAVIDRFLDVRELTPDNQILFHAAVRRAGKIAKVSPEKFSPDWLNEVLLRLDEMASRADRGEPPLELSDWIKVVPSKGRRIGPGWQ